MPKRTSSEHHMKQKDRYNARYRYTRNLGERYTRQEVGRIMMHTIPDVELAKELGRPVVSIRNTRSRIRKKLQDGTLKLI